MLQLNRTLPVALCLLAACANPDMKGPGDVAENPADSLRDPVTVMLKAYENDFVTCELTEGNELKGQLFANRPSAGDWERFTMYTKPDGRVVFQAANGKYVCSDALQGGLLVADRDKPGDWETFSLVPQDNGQMAIKTHDGSFVSADYGVEGARNGVLIGDRKELKEWERFTLLKDTVALP